MGAALIIVALTIGKSRGRAFSPYVRVGDALILVALTIGKSKLTFLRVATFTDKRRLSNAHPSLCSQRVATYIQLPLFLEAWLELTT